METAQLQTEFDKQLSSERFRVFDAKVLSEGRFAHAERIDYTQPASEGGGGGARPRHRSLRTGQILSDGRVILRIGVANYGTPHGRRHSLVMFDPKSATVANDPLSTITDAAEPSSDMAGVDLLQKAMDALPGWERDFRNHSQNVVRRAARRPLTPNRQRLQQAYDTALQAARFAAMNSQPNRLTLLCPCPG